MEIVWEEEVEATAREQDHKCMARASNFQTEEVTSPVLEATEAEDLIEVLTDMKLIHQVTVVI